MNCRLIFRHRKANISSISGLQTTYFCSKQYYNPMIQELIQERKKYPIQKNDISPSQKMAAFLMHGFTVLLSLTYGTIQPKKKHQDQSLQCGSIVLSYEVRWNEALTRDGVKLIMSKVKRNRGLRAHRKGNFI